jgi:hypothetical protein
MSAGSQIQMAPQATVNSGQPVHSQDSNMSTGMSHFAQQPFKYMQDKVHPPQMIVSNYIHVPSVFENGVRKSVDFTKTSQVTIV